MLSPSSDPNTVRIADDVQAKVQRFEAGPDLDTRLILVTASPAVSGPFTIIEGNRRAAALLLLDRLAGCEVFVGVSPAIRSYCWARHSHSPGSFRPWAAGG